MDFIVQTLLRGGSPSMAVRNKDFASLCRKIQTMKSRVIEKQIADDLPVKQGEVIQPVVEAMPPIEAIQPVVEAMRPVVEAMQQAV